MQSGPCGASISGPYSEALPATATATITAEEYGFETKGLKVPTAPPTGPPPVDFTKSARSAGIEQSEGSELTKVTLTAGRYALLCCITDRAGGPPHFMKGMLTEVVIK